MSLVSLASVVSRGSTKPQGIARNSDNTQDNDQLFVMVEIKEKRGWSRTKPPFDTGLFVYSGFSSLYVYAVCYRCVCGSECDEGWEGVTKLEKRRDR